MNNENSTLKREHNLETQKRHRKEVFWQIIIPLLFGGLVVLGLMILSAFSGDHQSKLADISLIWIIVPNLVGALLIIFMLVGVIYGLSKLSGGLPYYALKVQDFFNLVDSQAQKIDDKLVAPVIKGKAASASYKKLIEQILKR